MYAWAHCKFPDLDWNEVSQVKTDDWLAEYMRARKYIAQGQKKTCENDRSVLKVLRGCYSCTLAPAEKKGELDNAQHWLSEVLAVPHASSTEGSKGAMQATAEFDLKPAVAKAVQLWATALGHLAHNEVEQAVEMLQQVCMTANAA